jgi:hypothetical protein
MTPRRIRWVAQAVFVTAIVGMIVSFIREDSGVAVGFGLAAAIATMALIIVTAVAGEHGFAVGTVDEQRAEAIEAEIVALVDRGADEAAVRGLVRRAIELGRHAGPPPPPP